MSDSYTSGRAWLPTGEPKRKGLEGWRKQEVEGGSFWETAIAEEDGETLPDPGQPSVRSVPAAER